MTDRIPLAATALALALPLSAPTSALAIAFDNFQGRAQVAVYDSANPAATVLRADAPSFVPGVTRTLEIAPSPGGPGVVSMLLVPAWVGSYNDELYLSADGGQALSGTLSYGLDRPMNLDWSGVQSIALMFSYAAAHKLTVYASTDADDPADNPYGSALSVDIPLQYQSVVVLPLSSFAVNNASGQAVRWSDLDRLSFAFSGPTGSNMWLYAITSIAAPVSEPGTWAMWIAGLLAGARAMRRRA